jgi:uncharacterized protein (TIGR00375 family)
MAPGAWLPFDDHFRIRVVLDVTRYCNEIPPRIKAGARMQQFRADLHIHSRFSRATSKGLTPRLLAVWARVKGLDVLGTGDFTHPGWLDELEQELTLDSRSGLYTLKQQPRLDREVDWLAGFKPAGKTLFMLQGEISSIYKRGGKVRKVHNLVYMPNLEKAREFNARLAKVGNLASDGRPILGLDSRDLLEMVLETDPLAFLIPAHIWTPWFSLFGSKSGFDSMEECFGDLSRHIFALETGLSSDPEMNWCISALDRYRLVSNSDAHSAEKLGREANIFSGDISYEGIFRALRGEALGHKFLGTLEFFPEEGKYHLDGHRKCGVVLEPLESLARRNLCPVCGKPLTLGVLHRVLSLADRETFAQPPGQPGFTSLAPLTDLVSEIVGAGTNTKKVREFYARCVTRLGSEMDILLHAPLEDMARVSPMLAEGVSRMRRGEVLRTPGYDGEFGVIHMFSERERKEFRKGRSLAGVDIAPSRKRNVAKADPAPAPLAAAETEEPPLPAQGLNPEQLAAVSAGPGPVLVKAGPGTGKTHTLISRIVWLVEQGVNPRHILAVTFTRRAAEELEERLLRILGERHGENVALPRADTLHALAFEYWSKAYEEIPTLLSEESARRAFREANPDLPAAKLAAAWKRIARRREQMQPLDFDQPAFHNYVKLKESWNLADFTDLLEFWLEQIQSDIYVRPCTHVLVDEVQDLSALQLAVIKALLPPPPKGQEDDGGVGLFAIGDPKQSIYGFRGALADVEQDLRATWPSLEVVPLAQNYRSVQPVLDLASALFSEAQDPPRLTALSPARGQAQGQAQSLLHLFEAPTDGSEAAWIAERVRWLIGGASHSLADGQDKGGAADLPELQATLSPAQVAVLVRFRSLVRPLQRALERLGLPCSAPEEEAYWVEPRVQAILQAAGAFLGISAGAPAADVSCPDTILAKGPLAVQAYMQDVPPFDRLFWEGRAFRQLVKAYDEHEGWQGLLNHVSLQTRAEQAGRRSEHVRIMTLHAAKGLEFEAVFLPALEDGIMPFAGAALLTGTKGRNGDVDEDPERQETDLEEERRLLYVGMTRARLALYMSFARRRTLYGRELRLPVSRFLHLLPMEHVQRSTLKAHVRTKGEQLSLLD